MCKPICPYARNSAEVPVGKRSSRIISSCSPIPGICSETLLGPIVWRRAWNGHRSHVVGQPRRPSHELTGLWNSELGRREGFRVECRGNRARERVAVHEGNRRQSAPDPPAGPFGSSLRAPRAGTNRQLQSLSTITSGPQATEPSTSSDTTALVCSAHDRQPGARRDAQGPAGGPYATTVRQEGTT